jgi:hypothetical protein
MAERRRDARIPIDRPVKLQCCVTGRYLRGRTDNLSSSGALLEIEHPSLLVPGQRLRVGIAWNRGQVVLEQDDLAEATVVRSLGHGESQRVAVRFTQRQTLAIAG